MRPRDGFDMKRRSSACLIAVPYVLASIVAPATGEVGLFEVQKLRAPEFGPENEYGRAVAADGHVVVLGVRRDDDNGGNSGSAYVHRFDGSTWKLERKLLAADGGPDDQYGISVSVSGDVALIGAHRGGENGNRWGAAYVYRFDGSSWSFEQKLMASDGARHDRYGVSVSLSGNVAVVGAYRDDDNGDDSGASYVYRFDGTSWNEEQKIVASDGRARDRYGYSVSVSGDVVVVGAFDDDDTGTGRGSAYVYRFDGSSWNEEQRFVASDAAGGDSYGYSVSVSGDIAMVGADLSDENGVTAGSAYSYRYDGLSWSLEQKLLASDGAKGDRYGVSVSVSGDIAVIGAFWHAENGYGAGSAYAYHFDGSAWNREQKLLASDGEQGDRLGRAVAVSGDIAVVGAYHDRDNGWDAGSAYVYRVTNRCLMDLDRSGAVNVGDLRAVVAAWGPCGHCREDLNASRTVDLDDLIAVLNAWGPCPPMHSRSMSRR
jgi:hypothetical protein